MALWGSLANELKIERAFFVYEDPSARDESAEGPFAALGVEISRGAAPSAVEPQDLIAVTRSAAAPSVIAAAFDAASRYAAVSRKRVWLAIDTVGKIKIPADRPWISAAASYFPLALYEIYVEDFNPRDLAQKALEEYFAWKMRGGGLPKPEYFPGKPRARENFETLARRAPIAAAKARPFANEIASDLSSDPAERAEIVAALLRTFETEKPRELIRLIVEREEDFRSTLGLASEEGDDWDEEPPDPEEVASIGMVERFDTPLPPGVRLSRRINYYEFDVRIEEETNPLSREVTRYEVRENCRPVWRESLVALEDLDPETWSAKIGGRPLVAPEDVARYEANPDAFGVELADVPDGDVVHPRVVLDQTDHWSGKFAYAPAASVHPLPDSIAPAFANVEIDEESGEISLLRPVRAGEWLTVDLGEEFFGDTAYPHFALEALVEPPRNRDDELELVDVMMSHAWSAAAAERLGLVPAFALHAAQIMLPTGEDLTALAFGLCADVVPWKIEDADRATAAMVAIAEAVEKAKSEIVENFARRVAASAEPEEEGGIDAARMLAEIKKKAVESDDPEGLWRAARREWSDLSDYMETVQRTDGILHAQLLQLTLVLDEESARVMNPGYNRLVAAGEPRLGIDYVLPYTKEAIRRAAEEMKREQLDTWKRLFRDAGVDPEKTASWEQARSWARERDALIERVIDLDERNEMRKFVEFWKGYNEFTVAEPSTGERELVFSADELLKVRETEIAQKKERREKIMDERRKLDEAERAETEEMEERKRVRAEQKTAREDRRKEEIAEFERLGRAMIKRRGERGEFDFSSEDSYKIRRLFDVLDKNYRALIDGLNKRKLDRWYKWKASLDDAFERSPEAGHAIVTTNRYPKFVSVAVEILKEFEAYEMRRHAKKWRRALVAAGYEPAPKKKKKKKKKTEPPAKKKARTASPVSPAKDASAGPILSIPGAPIDAYDSASVFRATVAIATRARSDSVFFLYGTRGEGLVQQLQAVFRDATVLHKPAKGGAGGVASPDDARVDEITHFFALYGGDADARRWYEHLPRGTAGWPYLIATEASKDAIDPEARPLKGSDFEMRTREGEEDVFFIYRRVETVSLD